MKKLLFLAVALITTLATQAQSLYELKYYDKDDERTYLGLFFYTSEEECMLRCVSEKPERNGNILCWEKNYYCAFDKDEDGKYIYFLPEEAEEEDGTIIPWFTMAYDTDGELNGYAAVVFQNWNDDEIDDNNIEECDYFREIDIIKKDAEYFQQFYDKDEEMYERIMEARQLLLDQESDVNVVDNSHIDANGDVTMHFIVVAATKDETIGKSVETDLKLVRKDFSSIAKQLNIGYNEIIIQGNDFNKRNIENAIDKLRVQSNDILAFVYTGHGFRYDDDTDAYPRMFLSYGDNISKQLEMSTTEAFNRLVDKKARLTIFLSDCCNSKAGINRAEVESMAFGTRSINNNNDTRKLEQLFIQQSGTIRATAAKAGQYALCDASGGYLLTSFLSNIRAQVSAISKEAPSWKKILDNASRAVEKKTSNQIDEAGNDQEPQIVVKNVKLKPMPGANLAQVEENLSNDSFDNSSYSNNSSNEDNDDESDVIVGFICIGLPILIVILLLIIIIKLFRKKKN